MLTELKIGSRFGWQQIERYVRSGARVVAVVQDPERALRQVRTESPAWLGATAWTDIAPVLECFELRDADAPVWRSTLEVLQVTEDLSPGRRRDAGVVAAMPILEAVRPLVEDVLRARTARRYGRTFAESIAAGAVKAGRRRAFFSVLLDASEISVELRDAGTPSPSLAVAWWAPYSRRARAIVRDAESVLGAKGWQLHGSARGRRIEWRERLNTGRIDDRHLIDVVGELVTQRLSHLVQARALDWDAR